MATAVIFMRWENYLASTGGTDFFAAEPLTFNSRQERLHLLTSGDRLWLVSRSPDDGQYYFVAAMTVASRAHNPPESETGQLHGPYAVVCDRAKSQDLGKRFPAEALLRAFSADFHAAK